MTKKETGIQKDLSPAEWLVMKIIWELGEGAARDIYTVACKRHDWAVDTVKTMLRRLTEKGYLHTRQIGNSFLYTPSVPAVSVLQQALDTLLSHAVEGTVAPLVMHIVQNGDLSEEDIQELRAMLDGKSEKPTPKHSKKTNSTPKKSE